MNNILKLNDKKYTIQFADEASGLESLRELNKEGGLFNIGIEKTNEKIMVYFDIGANDGSTTIWGYEKFPNAKIIAVEPNPICIEAFDNNTRNLDRITLFENAVSLNEDEDVVLEFDEKRTMAGSVSKNKKVNNPTNSVNVKTISINNLLKKETEGLRKDQAILKIDIEGSEIDIINDKHFIEIVKENIGIFMIELHGHKSKQIKAAMIIDDIFEENCTIQLQGFKSAEINSISKFGERIPNSKLEKAWEIAKGII